MRKLGLFLFVLCITVTVSSARDSSRVVLRANNGSKKLLIAVMMTNPAGVKGGCNLIPVKDCQEDLFVNTGGYGTDKLGDEEDLSQANNESLELFYGPVVSGTHTITFESLAPVSFTGEIQTYGTDFSATPKQVLAGFISTNASLTYQMHINPTPGAPAPLIAKVVTFNVLRNDVSAAVKLSQLGDDKFTGSLVKNIDLAEKLAGVCGKRKAKKDKCEPAANVLRLFVKRLELANKKCDMPEACDEEKEWSSFRKAHGGDEDYKDFFRDWDKAEWHKHKKDCKRFVTDEALGIIKSDAEVQIKQYGGEVKDSGKSGK